MTRGYWYVVCGVSHFELHEHVVICLVQGAKVMDSEAVRNSTMANLYSKRSYPCLVHSEGCSSYCLHPGLAGFDETRVFLAEGYADAGAGRCGDHVVSGCSVIRSTAVAVGVFRLLSVAARKCSFQGRYSQG